MAYDLEKIAKQYGVDKVNDMVAEYVFDYGMRQAINDAGASALADAFEGSMDPDAYEALAKDGTKLKTERKAWGAANVAVVDKRRDELRADRVALFNAGKVPERKAGTGVDSFTKACRSIARLMLRVKMQEAGRPYAEFTGKSAEAQNDILDKVIDDNRDVVEREAKKRIKAQEAERALADSVKIDL